MGWFDGLFGDGNGKTLTADGDPSAGRAGDPFGRIIAEPVFDAFREAWKAGAGLFDLFGKEPVKIKAPVGPDSPNRRPDVAKVETFLDRTGHLDLQRTEGPTGYYGSRVDQGIRTFQKDHALKVDGLINPNGETLQTFGAMLSEGQQPSQQAAGFSSILSPSLPKSETLPERQMPLSTQATAPLREPVADWLGRRGASLVASKHQAATSSLPSAIQRAAADEKGNELARPGPQLSGTIRDQAPWHPTDAQSQRTSDRAVVNTGSSRIQAIIENRPVAFEVRDNPDADASDPWYASRSAGRTAVATFEQTIEQEARRQKVDPDLVKAIVFAENARGHYFGLAKTAEGFDVAETFLPMNINPDLWSRLGLSRKNATDPEINIRAGVTLLKRLSNCVRDPVPEKIATLYNATGSRLVTDYGAYVARAYREKPWME